MVETLTCEQLPLDASDPYTMAAARLLLNEVNRYENPAYDASEVEVIELIERAREARPGTETIVAILDRQQGTVIAAGRSSHRAQDSSSSDAYTHVAKIAVIERERGKGYLGVLLAEIDRAAQNVEDVTIRLTALVPEKFRRYGFRGEDDRLEMNVGTLALAGYLR